MRPTVFAQDFNGARLFFKVYMNRFQVIRWYSVIGLAALAVCTTAGRAEAFGNAAVLGTLGSGPASGGLSEGFEAGTKANYTAADATVTSGAWAMNDALVGALAGDARSGAKSVRLRNAGTLRMGFDKAGGAETVSVAHARYGTDGPSSFELWSSSDAGQTWARVGAPVTSAQTTLETATFQVHVDGRVRFEIRKTGGGTNRLNLDDVVISDFVPSKLRLASWNGRQLSVTSRDAAERAQIAAALEQFDAIAIQEVGDTQILGALKTALDARGGHWESSTSPPIGNTAGSTERYGVLYRSSEIHVVKTQALPEMVLETGTAFDREPFVFSLATNDGRFDWAFVDVHVTWGNTVANRVAEIKKLSDYYQIVVQSEKDVLVVGDFNRNANDASLTWLQTNAGIQTTTVSTVPTVITSTNTYDQIMLNPAFFTEYTGTHGVHAFDTAQFGGKTAAASLAVSDHRPVWIEVQPKAADDD